MTRYFFDTRNPAHVVDRIGLELHDRAAARLEALARIAEFAADVANLEEPGALVVTVRNEARDVVMNVHLVCSVEESPGRVSKPSGF